MPWTKVGKDDYVSPSGKHWTAAMIGAYKAKLHDEGKRDPGERKTHRKKRKVKKHKRAPLSMAG